MPALVNFLSGSNGSNMVAHSLFLCVNLINVLVGIIFGGFVFSQLGKNLLFTLTFVGCFSQMCSCVTSVTRYNLGEPFNMLYGGPGGALGTTGYIFVNFALIHGIFANSINRKLNITIGYLLVLVSMGIVFVITILTWDESKEHGVYLLFGIEVLVCQLLQIILMFITYRAHKNREIRLSKSILTFEVMNRLFVVCLCFHIFLILIGFTGIPVVYSTSIGLTYTNVLILMTFVGQMDFMKESARVDVKYQSIENSVEAVSISNK